MEINKALQTAFEDHSAEKRPKNSNTLAHANWVDLYIDWLEYQVLKQDKDNVIKDGNYYKAELLLLGKRIDELTKELSNNGYEFYIRITDASGNNMNPESFFIQNKTRTEVTKLKRVTTEVLIEKHHADNT